MTTPEVLQDLYTRSHDLEEFGASIQGDREPGLTADQVGVFVESYQTWFAEVMVVLPADLQERFRKEYEGGALNPKIKSFLEAPLEVSVVHKGPQPVQSADVFPYWSNPFDVRFRGPLLA